MNRAIVTAPERSEARQSMNNNAIHSAGSPQLPYEKFLAYGADSLTNAELLAIILRTGTASMPAMSLAQQILAAGGEENGRLSCLCSLSMHDLCQIRGIGEVKAVRLLCIAEISRRISQENAAESLSFRSPGSVARYFMESLRHERQENVILVLLDTRMTMIRSEVLSTGTVNLSLLSPRDVYMRALKGGAVYILLLHNHPSGDATPSEQDISATRKVREAGECLEIPLLDHIVIGDRCYTSMKEAGLL